MGIHCPLIASSRSSCGQGECYCRPGTTVFACFPLHSSGGTMFEFIVAVRIARWWRQLMHHCDCRMASAARQIRSSNEYRRGWAGRRFLSWFYSLAFVHGLIFLVPSKDVHAHSYLQPAAKTLVCYLPGQLHTSHNMRVPFVLTDVSGQGCRAPPGSRIQFLASVILWCAAFQA